MNIRDMKPVKVAVVGCGRISDIYFENLTKRFKIIQIVKCCSATGTSAERKAKQYGITSCTFEEILADPEIEIVVNLTPTPEHKEIIRRSLEAGKHVYTEKVITPTTEEALELVALAKEKGLYFCSSPEHFMGSAWQCARELIDKGMIGQVTSVHATSNSNTTAFADIFDFLNKPAGGTGHEYGIYLMTVMVSLLGPITDVCGMVRTQFPERMHSQIMHPNFGETYTYTNEDSLMGTLQFASGAVGTIHMNASTVMPLPHEFMIYGTEGALSLPNPGTFSGDVKLYRPGNPEPILVPPAHGLPHDSRGVAVAEMAWAIRMGRPARTEATLGTHCLEVLNGLKVSSDTGTYYQLTTTCERPNPLPSGYMNIPPLTFLEEGAIVF